ncbi:hypothetical protein SJAG_02387 [Schizosaccharomyces japonicus yFS275]|uniref:Early meiotic induction protein 1 n=1 Tax=Schizosaccharomyces japonicus (strain yFS275 / FY16936) TaxID=402676 RepID=B6K2B9_SCHJY|nr:hypothetical protein SJAG_02387 [Schizosaccharomyces japonicus yFS275]EEB07300.2 hypothetical protein SJAG_02387 [Schizosaccharomyces japonicus yFS275]
MTHTQKIKNEDLELQNMLGEDEATQLSSAKMPFSETTEPPSTSKYKWKSCSIAYYFDTMSMCLTAANQLRHYYRYGSMDVCKDYWKDFKWCLSTKVVDAAEEQKRLKQRYRDLWTEIRNGPNSEDIWTVRPDKDITRDQRED